MAQNQPQQSSGGSQSDFDRAMFEGGQKVYDGIVAGTVPDVTAALMDVHAEASDQAATPNN